MNTILTNFLVRLIVITTIVFLAHLFVLNALELPLFNNKILVSYLANSISAVLIFIMLFALRDKFKNQLGFIFLFGSVVKFGLFLFILFKPFYADGNLSKAEFFAFFVPYSFTHTIEIFSLSKWLNKI